VDFEARTVRSVTVEAARSWLEKFLALTAGVAHAKGASTGVIKAAALSPDGARLYVVGRMMNSTYHANSGWQITEESLGLQVVDVESGRIIATRDTEAERIRATPGGAYLLLDGWGERGHWTEALDADRLERTAHIRGWEVVATRRMDGQPMFLASRAAQGRTQFAVLAPRWFSTIHSWSVTGHASWVAP
jgi:hypothetical protein